MQANRCSCRRASTAGRRGFPRTVAFRPNQSASADSPFATSLSWWEGDPSNNRRAGFSRLGGMASALGMSEDFTSRLKPAPNKLVPAPHQLKLVANSMSAEADKQTPSLLCDDYDYDDPKKCVPVLRSQSHEPNIGSDVRRSGFPPLGSR